MLHEFTTRSWGTPGADGHLAAVPLPFELPRCVRVGVDRDHASLFDGHARQSSSGGSSRSGRELISTAVPVLAQASITARWSNVDSGLPRPTTILPVQWPRMSVCGLSIAASIRLVIGAGIHPQLGVDARYNDVETCEQILVLIEGSVFQDVHLDPGEDPERREILVQLRRPPRAVARACSASRPCATVRRALWSVSVQYSWPIVAGGFGHGRVSGCRRLTSPSARGSRPSAAGGARAGLPFERRGTSVSSCAQIRGLFASQGLGHDRAVVSPTPDRLDSRLFRDSLLQLGRDRRRVSRLRPCGRRAPCRSRLFVPRAGRRSARGLLRVPPLRA